MYAPLTRPDRCDHEGRVAFVEVLRGVNDPRENLLNELAWVRRRLVVEQTFGVPPQYMPGRLADLFDRAETCLAESAS